MHDTRNEIIIGSVGMLLAAGSVGLLAGFAVPLVGIMGRVVLHRGGRTSREPGIPLVIRRWPHPTVIVGPT